MPCGTCGFDRGSIASALDHRHSPCCREVAFAVLSARLHDLALQVCRQAPSLAEDLAQTIALRLSRSPVVQLSPCDQAATGYLRRALERALVDERRARRPALLDDLANDGPVEVADVRDTAPPMSAGAPDVSEVAWALADRLDAELEPASRRIRGMSARRRFVLIFRGLVELFLRRRGSFQSLLAEAGLVRAKANVLEAAQYRARGIMTKHLLQRLEATNDVDIRAELQTLVCTVAALKRPSRSPV